MNTALRPFDFPPFFTSFVGFDPMEQFFSPAIHFSTKSNAYPPYNIERVEDGKYIVTIALAGYSEDEIKITEQHNILTISGKHQNKTEDNNKNYIHKGIEDISFSKQFTLAENVKVTSAYMGKGILHIELIEEMPEESKPKEIKINHNKNLKKP